MAVTSLARPGQRPAGTSELREALAACWHAFIAVGLMSGLINMLYLTGSFYMLEVYDRVLPSRSVPTLIALSILAELVQAELLAGLREAGYADPIDQGANDDPPLQKPYGHLFLVGPQTPRVARASDDGRTVGGDRHPGARTSRAQPGLPAAARCRQCDAGARQHGFA